MQSYERENPWRSWIVGTITIDAERRDALLAAIRPLVQKTRQEGPGCLDYAFTADTVDDDRVVVVERWRDEITLAAHFMHPNFLRRRTRCMISGPGSR